MDQSNDTPDHLIYAKQRIRSGDYLQLSNDGQTLWRITRYVDGPDGGLLDERANRSFWALWKWHRAASTFTEDDLDTWDGWKPVGSGLTRMKDAIAKIKR